MFGSIKSRRCSTCGINFPPAFGKCQVCGGTTDALFNAPQDTDWQEKVKLAKAALEEPPPPSEDKIHNWRLIQLIDAGYPLKIALEIAPRYVGPDRIDLHKAVELVASGRCTPELAGKILL